MRYILILCLLLSACATSDPTRLWVKKWNDPYASIRQKQEAAADMERGDYVRYGRETAGIVNKNFSSNPADYLEKEIVYFKLALWAMNGIQYPAYNVVMHGKSQGPGYAESISKNVPTAREDANRYMRKLMEIPSSNLHLFSRLLICRIQELNHEFEACAADIRALIEPGALLWIFTDSPSTSASTFIVADFSGEEERIYQDKRGGEFLNLSRTICSGLLVCLGGLKTKDESVIRELENKKMGLQLVFMGHYGAIKGLKPL